MYDNILKLAKQYESIVKKADDVRTGESLPSACSEVLFNNMLWPSKDFPMGAGLEQPVFDPNHPVMTEYVWPVVDASSFAVINKKKIKVPAKIIIHYTPNSEVTFTSEPEAVAKHPKMIALAKKATEVLKASGVWADGQAIFGIGLQ
jgi:hypothetical protein